MRRLYLRIYLTVLGSLLVFALLVGIGWLAFGERAQDRGERELIADAIAELLPAGADAAQLQATLERWHRRAGIDLALFDADARPIAAAGAPLPAPRAADVRRWPRGGVATLRLPDGRWASARYARARDGPPWIAPTALVAMALAVGIAAYPFARRLTRRLERLQRGVEALGGGELSARVPVQGNDEVAALARSFNRAAQRIETLVDANRALLSNASHELRSPLARIRMAIELIGKDPRPELQAELRRNVAELDQLVDEILLASRLHAQSGATAAADGANRAVERIDLAALLAEECARVDATLDASPCVIDGEAALLRRLVRNLLENAQRHGGGTPIDVALRAQQLDVAVEVCDRGPGVPQHERERVFEPFHRIAGRSEAAGGAGLGLSIVRQIAQRHHGRVECVPRAGGGSCFRVTLPRPATGAGGDDAQPAEGGARRPTTTG